MKLPLSHLKLASLPTDLTLLPAAQARDLGTILESCLFLTSHIQSESKSCWLWIQNPTPSHFSTATTLVQSINNEQLASNLAPNPLFSTRNQNGPLGRGVRWRHFCSKPSQGTPPHLIASERQVVQVPGPSPLPLSAPSVSSPNASPSLFSLLQPLASSWLFRNSRHSAAFRA